MIKDFVWFIVAALGGGVIFAVIQQVLAKNKTVQKITNKEQKIVQGLVEKGIVSQAVLDNMSKFAKQEAEEAFSPEKLKEGLVNVNNGVKWAKAVVNEFNLRTLLIRLAILAVVIGAIYGWGKYSALKVKPISVTIGYEQEISMAVPRGAKALYKAANSSTLYWVLDTGEKIVVQVKDIPSLKEALKPYGFDVKPFVTAGGSIGEKGASGEAGLGLQVFRWYKANLNAWLTNIGAYLGVGYKLTANCDALVGVGKGYSGDNRVYGGLKWKF